MKRERMNKVRNIIRFLLLIVIYSVIVMSDRKRFFISLGITAIIIICLVRAKVINNIIELLEYRQRLAKIEKMYEEFEIAKETGFYKIMQCGKIFELGVSDRDVNVMAEKLIIYCNSYIHEVPKNNIAFRDYYSESLSTVKTIKVLVENKKCSNRRYQT